jgi:hypothetical protein
MSRLVSFFSKGEWIAFLAGLAVIGVAFILLPDAPGPKDNPLQGLIYFGLFIVMIGAKIWLNKKNIPACFLAGVFLSLAIGFIILA